MPKKPRRTSNSLRRSVEALVKEQLATFADEQRKLREDPETIERRRLSDQISAQLAGRLHIRRELPQG